MKPIPLRWFGVSLVVGSAVTSPAGAAPSDRTPIVQSLDAHIPVAPVPVPIAGKKHLAYEVHLTNFARSEVALTRLAVIDPATKTNLVDLRDAALTTTLGRPGAGDVKDPRVIGSGMRAIAYLWVPVGAGLAAPTKLQHTIEFDRLQQDARRHGIMDGLTIDVRQDAAPVLDPPLRGGPWVAVYAPLMVGGHRTSIYTIDGRARIPARFAIDWVKLDDEGKAARGDNARIANFHGYGADVLAVADGVVTAAVDDMPDSEIAKASHAIPLEKHGGNHITLDLGSGSFAFYEHLKPGSVRVKAGDRVTRGQVIAQLGNSGSSSSGPHLHFHVADDKAPLGGEGLPYVLRGFQVVDAFDSLEAAGSGVPWKPAPAGTGGARSNELPAPNVVVLLPSQR